MKKTKVIIPALGILLLSTAASVTGTVAWFTTNNSVTASTMTIKANVTGNLFIAEGASQTLDSVNKTSVVFSTAQQDLALTPVDLKQATGVASVGVPGENGYTTAPTIDTAGKADQSKIVEKGTISPVAASGIGGYALASYVSIANKQTVAGNFGLKPSVALTVNAVADNLAGAIRGGIVIGTNSTDGVFYESNDCDYTEGTAAASLTWDNFPGSTNATKLTDNIVYSVALVLWYEGDDADCFVNNALHLDNCSAVWTFQSVKPAD